MLAQRLPSKPCPTTFLAREQAILGGSFSPTGLGSGGGVLDSSASAFPDLDTLDGNTPIQCQRHPRSVGKERGDGSGDFENIPSMGSLNEPPPTNTKLTGNADLDQFKGQFPDLDVVHDTVNLCF